jgi:hypothetical protein
MNPSPAVEELAISIVAKNLNPTLLTREFLVYSGIIPSDWSLASQPILNSQVAHVAFTNGINISIQMSAVTFSENILVKTQESVIVPTLIRKCVGWQRFRAWTTSTLPSMQRTNIGVVVGKVTTSDALGKFGDMVMGCDRCLSLQ